MSASTLRDKLENAKFRRYMARKQGFRTAVLFWDWLISDLTSQLQTVAA